MGFEVKKTGHSGAKHGHGFWGRKADAKHQSSRTRRKNDAEEIRNAVAESDNQDADIAEGRTE